jgi:hypothetical protein
MDQTDLDFSNHRNFLTQPHGLHRGTGWRASAGAFDFRCVDVAKQNPNDDLIAFQFRGSSKFSWDGTRRNMEFPAVSPKLLPRQDYCDTIRTFKHFNLLTSYILQAASFYRFQI